MHNTTKHKLWANEYADFGLLLPVAQNKPQAKSIFWEENNLAIQENPKHIKNIDQWISAFSVFMAIYCQKYKEATPDLIKYMDIVRNMARQKGNWYQYD